MKADLNAVNGKNQMDQGKKIESLIMGNHHPVQNSVTNSFQSK